VALESGGDVAALASDTTLGTIIEYTGEMRVKALPTNIITIIVVADEDGAMQRAMKVLESIPHAAQKPYMLSERTDRRYKVPEGTDVVLGTPEVVNFVLTSEVMLIEDVKFIVWNEVDELVSHLEFTYSLIRLSQQVACSSGIQSIYTYPELAIPIVSTILRASPSVLWLDENLAAPAVRSEAVRSDLALTNETAETRQSNLSIYSQTTRTQERILERPVGDKIDNDDYVVATTTAYKWNEGDNCAFYDHNGSPVRKEFAYGWMRARVKELLPGGVVVVAFFRPRSGSLVEDEVKVQTGDLDRIRHIEGSFEQNLDVLLRNYIAEQSKARKAKRQKTGDDAKGPATSDLALLVDAHITVCVADRRNTTQYRKKNLDGQPIVRKGLWLLDWPNIVAAFEYIHPMEYGRLLEGRGGDRRDVVSYFRKNRYEKIEFIKLYREM